MKARLLFAVVLIAILAFLMTGAGQAQGPQAVRPRAVTPPSGWVVQTIDSGSNNVGRYASLAVRGAGLNVSYYDSTNSDLRYAYPVSSGGNCGPNATWKCQTIDSAGYVGQYSSITMPQGTGPITYGPGIAYMDSTNLALKFAEYVMFPFPPHWNIVTVDNPTTGWAGSGTSVKYDSTGAVHIAYTSGNTTAKSLMYAHWVSSGGNCGEGSAAGQWNCDVITSNPAFSYSDISLEVDELNRPYIAYYDPMNHQPYLAIKTGVMGNCGPFASWYCQSIDGSSNANMGYYTSIAAIPGTPSNQQGIAYQDPYNQKLKFAERFTQPNYHLDVNTIAVSSGANTGLYTSIKYGTDLVPHIAYQVTDASGTYLWHAYRVGTGGNCGMMGIAGKWQCDAIDFGPNLAFNNSIGMVGTRPYIVYYDSANGVLKLAYQQAQVLLPFVKR